MSSFFQPNPNQRKEKKAGSSGLKRRERTAARGDLVNQKKDGTENAVVQRKKGKNELTRRRHFTRKCSFTFAHDEIDHDNQQWYNVQKNPGCAGVKR